MYSRAFELINSEKNNIATQINEKLGKTFFDLEN